MIPRPTNKPGDFVLGSLESRVAARAMLELIKGERKKDLDLVKIEFRGLPGGDRILEYYTPKKDRGR